jgi:hypothetical protein
LFWSAYELGHEPTKKPKKTRTHFSLSRALFAVSANGEVLWSGGAADDYIRDVDNWDGEALPTLVNPGMINNGDTAEVLGRTDLNGMDLTVSGGSTIHAGSGVALRYGDGSITLNSGHLDIEYGNISYLGRASGAGTININSGSTATFAGSLSLGYTTQQGFVNQMGGSMDIGGTLYLQVNASFAPDGPISGNVYTLSGGSVTAGDLNVSPQGGTTDYFNFTTGSTGTLTITQSSFDFASYIADGEIRLNGNANSDYDDFVVTTGSTEGTDWTRLALIPEPSTSALLASLSALTAIMLRRRR